MSPLRLIGHIRLVVSRVVVVVVPHLQLLVLALNDAAQRLADTDKNVAARRNLKNPLLEVLNLVAHDAVLLREPVDLVLHVALVALLHRVVHLLHGQLDDVGRELLVLLRELLVLLRELLVLLRELLVLLRELLVLLRELPGLLLEVLNRVAHDAVLLLERLVLLLALVRDDGVVVGVLPHVLHLLRVRLAHSLHLLRVRLAHSLHLLRVRLAHGHHLLRVRLAHGLHRLVALLVLVLQILVLLRELCVHLLNRVRGNGGLLVKRHDCEGVCWCYSICKFYLDYNTQ